MNRRSLLKNMVLAAGATAAVGSKTAIAGTTDKKKPVLTVAHITDVHIRPDYNAPERFKHCLEDIKKHKVDFFLNGGDSIYDASYDSVKRERAMELWALWDKCLETISGYDVYSCIGNHDPWWKAPEKTDDMYGKPYVVKRLKIPARYYSVHKNGWHFIILDGNNEKISLDKEQFDWLEKELNSLPANTPVLLMSHYPILGTTQVLEGGGHSDCKELKDLFWKHKDKVKICVGGHNHLYDKTLYNSVYYCCNGAMSGYWWEKGDKHSAGECYNQETPPGYAILKLYADGTVENVYYAHGY